MLNKTRFSKSEIEKAFPRVVLNYHAWPKRSADRLLILLSIAACFDFDNAHYREVDVNDLIMTWNAHFGSHLNVDHITLRRELVDARILERSADGGTYSVIPDDVLTENVSVIRSLDLEALVDQEERRRLQTRQRYLNATG